MRLRFRENMRHGYIMNFVAGFRKNFSMLKIQTLKNASKLFPVN